MRMLHTMLRVGNLERSLAFYTEVLGMTLLRNVIMKKVALLWLLWAMVMKKTILY